MLCMLDMLGVLGKQDMLGMLFMLGMLDMLGMFFIMCMLKQQNIRLNYLNTNNFVYDEAINTNSISEYILDTRL